MPDIERRVASKDIFFEEESMLQRVHSSFEKKISEQTAAYISERDYVSSSNFEEQDKQIHFSSANKELIKQIGISKLYSSLRDNPYFAHIKLKDKSRGDIAELTRRFIAMNVGTAYVGKFRELLLRHFVLYVSHCLMRKAPNSC